jgi:hypothetical protein
VEPDATVVGFLEAARERHAIEIARFRRRPLLADEEERVAADQHPLRHVHVAVFADDARRFKERRHSCRRR